MTGSKRFARYLCIALLLTASAAADFADFASSPDGIEVSRDGLDYSNVRIEPARRGGTPGLAFVFSGTHDLHYYAKPDTAPDPELVLTISPTSESLEFGQPVFPEWEVFRDPTGLEVEVFAGDFTVFIPITSAKPDTTTAEVNVTISGITCTSSSCLPPFEIETQTTIDYSAASSWPVISGPATDPNTPTDSNAPTKTQSTTPGPDYTLGFALLLAFIAGLALNVMPCVWPVLPLIVMRIVQQSKDIKGRSFTLGLAFCLGILLFFAALATVNIILQVFYGTVLGWGDPFRNPNIVSGIVIGLVFLAMFMFGLLNFALPSSIAGSGNSGSGYVGSIGMGFLAAVLSTPCGFGVLAAAFGWAQTQHWAIATIVILTIGIGMAVPYVILTSIPGLLNRLPRPGRWMEIIKQAMGFTLLVLAVKFLHALSDERRDGVLYFSVFMALGIWIWGTWVDFNTPRPRKYTIRFIALAIIAVSGWLFLPPKTELIDWQPWDTARIQTAQSNGRPVLIDFTADWCFNCVVVEKLIYSAPAVADLIKSKKVLTIRADTTEKKAPATIALKETYKESGALPVNMLFPPDSREPIRWHGTNFKQELITALEKL